MSGNDSRLDSTRYLPKGPVVSRVKIHSPEKELKPCAQITDDQIVISKSISKLESLSIMLPVEEQKLPLKRLPVDILNQEPTRLPSDHLKKVPIPSPMEMVKFNPILLPQKKKISIDKFKTHTLGSITDLLTKSPLSSLPSKSPSVFGGTKTIVIRQVPDLITN